jgi:hypothetical protein
MGMVPSLKLLEHGEAGHQFVVVALLGPPSDCPGSPSHHLRVAPGLKEEAGNGGLDVNALAHLGTLESGIVYPAGVAGWPTSSIASLVYKYRWLEPHLLLADWAARDRRRLSDADLLSRTEGWPKVFSRIEHELCLTRREVIPALVGGIVH